MAKLLKLTGLNTASPQILRPYIARLKTVSRPNNGVRTTSTALELFTQHTTATGTKK